MCGKRLWRDTDRCVFSHVHVCVPAHTKKSIRKIKSQQILYEDYEVTGIFPQCRKCHSN